MTSFVYRIYDARDMLLYVGLTDKMSERIGSHKGQQPWRGEISHFTFREFNTRGHAHKVEQRAIRLLRPAKNNPKNPPKPWPKKPYLWESGFEGTEGCEHDWAFTLTPGIVMCRRCGLRHVGDLRCKRSKKEPTDAD